MTPKLKLGEASEIVFLVGQKIAFTAAITNTTNIHSIKPNHHDRYNHLINCNWICIIKQKPCESGIDTKYELWSSLPAVQIQQISFFSSVKSQAQHTKL